MSELTARQREIWDMARSKEEGGEGLIYREIATRLGISENVVAKTLRVARKKLGVSGDKGKWKRTEEHRPEVAGAVLDAMTEPFSQKVGELAQELGVSDRVVRGMIQRNLVRRGKFVSEVKRLKTAEISQMLDEKIYLLGQYLDEYIVSQASARDNAMAMAQLIEKRALLRGEPTQIVSDHERAKLHELAPALLAEIARRGLTLPGVITEKTVEPA